MQIEEGRRRPADRLRRFAHQRPVSLALLALAALALLFAVGLGVARAPRGVTLERGSTGDIDGSGPASANGVTSEGEGDAEDGSGGGSGGEVDTAAGADEPIVVDVGGAVRSPGVVSLSRGDRVADAVRAAGGLADDADVSSINQAAPVTDGQKVLVPRVGEVPSAVTGLAAGSGQAVGTGADGTSGLMGGSGTTGASGGSPSGLINVNTATAEVLDGLPGVGPATAQAIVDERTQNGPFESVDDLMRVTGIGEKKLEKLRASACV